MAGPDGRATIRDQRAYRLKAYSRTAAPTRLFPRSAGDLLDYAGRFPAQVGMVESRLVTLGQGLSYFRATYEAPGEDGILAMRADGDAFKFCFSYCDRPTAKYTEGLPVSLHFPGEVQLHPLTVVAEMVQPGMHAQFRCILTSGEFLEDVVSELRLPGGAVPAPRRGSREPWMMSMPIPVDVDRALSLVEACPLGGRLRRLYIEGKVLEVVASLLARMCPGTEGLGEAARIRPRDARRVLDAHDIVRSRLDDLPSLRELAREVGMSATSLKRAWRAVFGMPVFQYVRSERLALARTLLAQGDLTVSEVADRVGYESLSWFSIAFKRQFGVLPSEIWPRAVKERSAADNADR